MAIERINSKNLERKKLKLLNDIGYLVEGEAILRCPVVTGNMRSKITHSLEGNDTIRIGTVGVPYASFVENGTNIMIAAHGPHDPENPVRDWEALRKRGGSGQTMPFIRSSVFVCEPKIKELISRAFQK